MPQTLAPPWPGDLSYGSSFQFAIPVSQRAHIPDRTFFAACLLATGAKPRVVPGKVATWTYLLHRAVGSQQIVTARVGTEIEVVRPTEVIELE